MAVQNTPSQSTAGVDSRTIPVRDSEPIDLMRRVEAAYLEHFGGEPEHRGGWYEPDGWKRVSRVFERLDKGGDILDVGTGAGQFANALELSGQFRSVTTIDTASFGNFVDLTDGMARHKMSVAEMTFEDDAFDVVTCMEVLEHLPEDIFLPAIAELRRVCRGQLVITVPYREPEPLSATHVRRFEDEDLRRLFPDAEFAILRRPRKPWVMIQERFDGAPNRIAVSDAEQLLALRKRVEALEEELKALRRRKVLRAANWVGRRARQGRAAMRRLPAPGPLERFRR